MIVLVTEMAETLGDGLKARPFGLVIERVIAIGAIDDPAEQHQRSIVGQLVLLQDGLERAFLAMMAELESLMS